MVQQESIKNLWPVNRGSKSLSEQASKLRRLRLRRGRLRIPQDFPTRPPEFPTRHAIVVVPIAAVSTPDFVTPPATLPLAKVRRRLGKPGLEVLGDEVEVPDEHVVGVTVVSTVCAGERAIQGSPAATLSDHVVLDLISQA